MQDASQRPGFHRVMTSLSKIYTRAKAASKGRPSGASLSGSEGVNPLWNKGVKKEGTGSGSGSGSGGTKTSGDAPPPEERSPLMADRSRAR